MKNKKVDALSFDDVPGLGPVGVKALNKEGYTTTMELMCKHPTFLKEVTGMDKDKAGLAFAFMKKKLIDANLLDKQEMTATELLKKRQEIKRVTIGCKGLDKLLNGGVECKSITEFYGEEGSGKTQISHTLAIQVQRPVSEGGLMEPKQAPPLVLYIDTENTCRPERFVSILEGKNLITQIPKPIKQKLLDGKDLTKEEQDNYDALKKQQETEAAKYLNNIIVQRATNAYQQFLLIQNAMKLVQHTNIKMIIIDSGTALIRSEYLERGTTGAKFKLLNEMIHDLKMIAENFNIVVIFINQIYNKPDQDWGRDPDIPFGGHIIGHTIPYRIKLEISGRKHKATIKKSPYQGNDEVKFNITEGGLSDIE